MRLGVLVGLLGLVGFATASAGPAAPAADFEWVLTKTEINPAKAPQPPHARLTVKNGHIDYDWPGSPRTEFDIDWTLPAAKVEPGKPLVFNVTASGRLTGGTDTQGYRTATVILHHNDRWVDTALEIGQSCTDPIGTAPISCTPPVRETGKLSRATPTYGTSFTMGIGLLNCSNCVVRYTYTAKKPTSGTPKPKPKPKPEPPPASPSKDTLDISWTMPRRFGVQGKDGLTHYPTPDEITPASFPVELVVRPKGSRQCRDSDAIAWSGPHAGRITRPGGCRFRAEFPVEGTFELKASLKGRDGFTAQGRVQVVVQDWLIFGLGDSNGSGEGAPDIPSPPLPARKAPVWKSLQCDRSAYSYQAQTARSIENTNPKTSVTFVHRACSGASIENGMIGPYGGINPKAGPALGAQVPAMGRLAGKREIDAVIISIGVNDLKFGSMVEHCILYPTCYNRGYPKLTSPDTLDEVMKEYFRQLPGRYDQLAAALTRVGVPPERVFLTQYFDSTRDENEKFCDPLIEIDPRLLSAAAALTPTGFLSTLVTLYATATPPVFTQDEARWAHDWVLQRLNRQVASVAKKHGWGLISGAPGLFRKHGYCSNDPWIVGLFESFERQHDHNGTLHATPFGNAQSAKLAIPVVKKTLYPGGKTRPPR
jgi:lysophospholipase L1-like esterase